MCKTIEERRSERKKQTAEVFTPPKLVSDMLDKLPDTVWEDGKTFCDPACGDGNFLIQVLWRKIAENEQDPTEALESVYGVDIMQDNIRECRLRLLKMISLFDTVDEEHIKTVLTNIVHLSLKYHPQGSLGYDFSFKPKPNKRDVARWMGWVTDGTLAAVELPVSAESIETSIELEPDLFSEDNDYAD